MRNGRYKSRLLLLLLEEEKSPEGLLKLVPVPVYLKEVLFRRRRLRLLFLFLLGLHLVGLLYRLVFLIRLYGIVVGRR